MKNENPRKEFHLNKKRKKERGKRQENIREITTKISSASLVWKRKQKNKKISAKKKNLYIKL